MIHKPILLPAVMSGALMLLPACTGILDGVYDEPEVRTRSVAEGELYIDASDWEKWHYIDLREIAGASAETGEIDTSTFWRTYGVPEATGEIRDHDGKADEAFRPESGTPGIYTYWYDVFGAGVSRREFRGYTYSEPQEEPENWTFAVHRNNVRTNRGAVAATDFTSVDLLPEGTSWLNDLEFTPDTWNETDVWTIQDRMLLGIIGNQGIAVNEVLGQWLTMDIPPMPPVYNLDSRVFVLRLSDGTFAALQLSDYMSNTDTKCHLTIKYRYPL